MHKIKNSLKLCFFLCIFLLYGCSKINSIEPFDDKQANILLRQFYAAKPAKQMIAIKLPDRLAWKKIDVSEMSLGTAAMLIPVNESATNWQESITTEEVGYVRVPHLTLATFVKNEFQKANKACRYVNDAILNETDTTIIFTLELSQCSKQKDQTQIGKAFAGKDAIYAIRYAALTGKVTQKRYDQIADAVKTSWLLRNPGYHS